MSAAGDRYTQQKPLETENCCASRDLHSLASCTLRAKKAISMTPRLVVLWLAARAAADDNSSNKEQDYASLKLKPRVVSFNVMVAGLSGLGKTTTCNMLFDAWQGNAPSQEKRKIRRATPHVDVS